MPAKSLKPFGLEAKVKRLEDRGFDETYISQDVSLMGIPTHTIRPKCSQCETLVINGVACHETGCPNAKHECHGCNQLIPINQKYCEDCQ